MPYGMRNAVPSLAQSMVYRGAGIGGPNNNAAMQQQLANPGMMRPQIQSMLGGPQPAQARFGQAAAQAMGPALRGMPMPPQAQAGLFNAAQQMNTREGLPGMAQQAYQGGLNSMFGSPTFNPATPPMQGHFMPPPVQGPVPGTAPAPGVAAPAPLPGRIPY